MENAATVAERVVANELESSPHAPSSIKRYHSIPSIGLVYEHTPWGILNVLLAQSSHVSSQSSASMISPVFVSHAARKK